MIKIIIKYFILVIFSYGLFFEVRSEENFYLEAIKKYEQKKFEKSKFLFQKSIVYNPKHSNSYLYLAKIFNSEENEIEEEKNLETALLLDPKNEEAIFMLMELALKKSNYSQVKDLSEKFQKVCEKLCNQNDKIKKSLKDIEPKNES